jgi:hypothetical protein
MRDGAAVRSTATAPGAALALAALVLGLLHAAFSVFWGLGGTWLLDTVSGSLEEGARSGARVAVWGAALLKAIAAVLPLAAVRRPGDRRLRALAWLEAGILIVYGGVLTAGGLLVQAGVIRAAADADEKAIAWHAYFWDPWFLLWGLLVAAAPRRGRAAGRR